MKNLFDELQAKADANGDGKLTQADLADLKDKLPAEKLGDLQKLADKNGDGKVDLNDLKSLGMDDLMNGIKDKLGNLGDVFGGIK